MLSIGYAKWITSHYCYSPVFSMIVQRELKKLKRKIINVRKKREREPKCLAGKEKVLVDRWGKPH